MPDQPPIPLIVDPWRELNNERQKHLATLEFLARILERIGLRDGTGATGKNVCKLCIEIPMGRNPATWQSRCPAHTLRAYVPEQQRRLEAPIRKPRQAGPAALSETELAAVSEPDAAQGS